VRPDPADQHRGAIIVWQDKRDALNTKTDIYAQRVDIESGISLWPTTNDPYGVQVCDNDEEQVNPKVDVDADVAAVAWEDDRNAQDWDIYGNGVDAVTGSLVDASGVAVCTESYDQKSVEVECKSDTSTFCWEDYRRYPQSDIYAQEVNTVTWSYYWTGNGIPVTHAKTRQYKPEVGKRVFVYMDDRRDTIANDNQDDMNIYAQRMGDDCDGPTNMHWKDELVKWTLDTDAQDHRFAKDEIGNTYVVWYEDRELPAYDINVSGVYIQKLDRDGVPRWLNGGILLSDTNNASGKPDVCIDGDGGAIASWHETVSGSNIVVVKRVNADGSIAWTGYPSTTPASNPRMVDDDNGGAYIAYENTADIRICLFDLNGNESFNERFDQSMAPETHIRPLIVKDRLSGCYVAGYDDAGGMIRCTYANSTAPVITADVLNIAPLESYDMSTDPIMNTYSTYDALLVASEGENIFAKKVRWYSSGGINIVSVPAGTVPADAMLVAGASPDYYLSMPVVDYDSVAVSVGGGGGAIVAWNKKYRSGPGSPVYYHKVYTTQADWVTGTPAVVPRLPGWPIEVSMECFEETHPDIGKENKHDRMVNGQSNESCFGFIVWHEYSERSCAYKAIVAQEVDYSYDLTTNPPPEPRTWDPDGELLNPQSGAVNQYTPLLLVYPNDTATVYWMDTRAGDPVIAGTRLISHENEIALLKNTAGGGGTKPEAVFLSGNYPNPFNANQGTLIRFRLEEDALVVLRVTDLLGREVAVLKSEYTPGGDHSVMFTPGDIPAGVYMYTLTAGNRVLTRSMLLVR